MFIVIFLTATLFALSLYLYQQRRAVNLPMYKMGMGMFPIPGI